MFCNNCGTKIGDGKKFCTNCGKAVGVKLVGSLKPSESIPSNAKPVPWITRRIKILITVGVLIVLLPILAAIVLASLTAARQKGNEAVQKDMGATSVTQNGWQLYTSVADKFSVLFPVYPTYESKADDSGEVSYEYRTYKAVSGQNTFEVARYVYKDEIDVSKPDDLLETYLTSFTKGADGQLVSSNYTYSGNYRALDFHISTASQEDVRGRIILVGQTFYLVAEDYFTQNYDGGEYQRFINSLSIQ